MSDENSTPLVNISGVNLGEFAKPADRLVKKVSNVVGGILAPWLIPKVAKAEAEAAIIKTKAEIEITDLHRRAMHRFIEEEAMHQKNMEDITAKSLPYLTDQAAPESVSNDWITNFFDKSRFVSDEQMQELWSKVLVEEANSPGTYSKRTVRFLSDLDKSDALLFSNLCRFVWKVDGLAPLIFDMRASIYHKTA